jgi:hypothetical protein
MEFHGISFQEYKAISFLIFFWVAQKASLLFLAVRQVSQQNSIHLV